MTLGIQNLVENYALKEGITKTEAEHRIKSVTDFLCDTIVEYGGVSLRDKFTIKTKVLSEKKVASWNNQYYTVPERYTLRISVGKELLNRLNSK